MDICAGIDPGLGGAIVALDDSGGLLSWADTPTILLAAGRSKRDYDLPGMVRILRDWADTPRLLVVLERQQCRPGQSAPATYTTGRGYGLWEGILAALEIPYQTVHPATWSRAMLGGLSGDTKARSLLRAAQLCPELPLRRPNGRKDTQHGRSDAALLALWGIRQMKGEK
jgi:crossover junction endodeoxyribonuclease RuvC